MRKTLRRPTRAVLAGIALSATLPLAVPANAGARQGAGERTMLGTAKLMAFVATTDAGRARAFYEKTLGLRLVADESFALVFDSNGTQLRVQKVQKVQPVPGTVLGWEVPSIAEAVAALRQRGVTFERVGFVKQDDMGVWTTEDGTKVAWFKDPDGNLLSITQFRNMR